MTSCQERGLVIPSDLYPNIFFTKSNVSFIKIPLSNLSLKVSLVLFLVFKNPTLEVMRPEDPRAEFYTTLVQKIFK